MQERVYDTKSAAQSILHGFAVRHIDFPMTAKGFRPPVPNQDSGEHMPSKAVLYLPMLSVDGNVNSSNGWMHAC